MNMKSSDLIPGKLYRITKPKIHFYEKAWVEKFYPVGTTIMFLYETPHQAINLTWLYYLVGTRKLHHSCHYDLMSNIDYLESI